MKRVLFGILLLFLGVGSLVLYLYIQSPDVSILRAHYPVIQYQGSKAPTKVGFVRRKPSGWVSFNEISPVAVGAVLVSEDAAFYGHPGYDVQQIKEAFKEDIKARRFARGASTITQQLARNLFLEKEKKIWRKIKEVLLAIKLERELSKKKILELYFNVVDWGRGIYGINRASQYYFHKGPGALTAKEGAFLAMLLPNPRLYASSFYKGQLTPYAEAAIDRILRKMVQGGFITSEEEAAARHLPLPFEQAISETDANLND